MNETRPKAIVLLSGGIDSATTAAIALSDGFDVCALTIRYGQRHGMESRAAEEIARTIGVCDHKIQTIDLRAFGGSALSRVIGGVP